MDALEFIYVLALTDGYWYVGKTKNIEKRMLDHMSGKGSVWTKVHPMIEYTDIYLKKNAYDEDTKTLELMRKYGIDKVRGGSFCQLELSDESIIVINRMIRSSEDACFICGMNGHYTNDCEEECEFKDCYTFKYTNKNRFIEIVTEPGDKKFKGFILKFKNNKDEIKIIPLIKDFFNYFLKNSATFSSKDKTLHVQIVVDDDDLRAAIVKHLDKITLEELTNRTYINVESEVQLSDLMQYIYDNLDTTFQVYLLDIKNGYYYFENPYVSVNGPNPFINEGGFFGFTECLKKKRGKYDIVYDSLPYRIIYLTPSGIKLSERKAISNSIKLYINGIY